MFPKIFTRITRFLTDSVIGLWVATVYGLLRLSWRVRYRGTTAHDRVIGPRIYAHWHGDELLLIGAHAFRKMAVLSSRSRDGSLLAWVLRYLGYRVVRGSSSRGGAGGLKGLIDQVIRHKSDASLAVDGPRGPAGKVKLGVVKLAELTQRPLMPGVAAARRRYIFERAWNRCYLPYPFTVCAVLYGDPIEVPRGLSDDEMEAIRLKLESALTTLKEQAEADVGLRNRRLDLQPAR